MQWLLLLTGASVAAASQDGYYHFDANRNGKAEYLVETSSLPINGSMEFFDSSSGWVRLMRVEDAKSGQHLADCAFMGLNDNKWHSMNWTLYEDSLLCQTERRGEDSREGYYDHAKTLAIRFDANYSSGLTYDGQHPPACVRNITIRDQYLPVCSQVTSAKKFTATAAVCGCPEEVMPAKTTKMTVTTAKPKKASTSGKTLGPNLPPKKQNVYYFSKENGSKVEWLIEDGFPVIGRYQYLTVPKRLFSNYTYHLTIYDLDSGKTLAICNTNEMSNGRSWLNFMWVLQPWGIDCVYGDVDNYPENNNNIFSKSWDTSNGITRFSLRLDTDNPPAAIANLNLLGEYTVKGCPPVGPPAIKNFISTGLICEKPAEEMPTTSTIVGKEKETPVYLTTRKSKVEWIVDPSKVEMPVQGRYEYINAPPDPAYKNQTYTLVVYDCDNGLELANCSSNTTVSNGQPWLKFHFILWPGVLSCYLPNGNFSWLIEPKPKRYMLKFEKRPVGPKPIALKNIYLNEAMPINGCPPVGPSFVKNVTISDLSCNGTDYSGETTNLPGRKATKSPPRKTTPRPEKEKMTVYHYSTERTANVEWVVGIESVTHLLVMGGFEFLRAPPDPSYHNRTYILEVYNYDTGEEIARCASNATASKKKKWVSTVFILYQEGLICYGGEAYMTSISYKSAERLSIRFDTNGPRPTAIRNLFFGERPILPVTGCPPVVPPYLGSVITDGLLCDEEGASGGKTPAPRKEDKQIVYHFSTIKKTKAEWIVDTTKQEYVSGNYEYISAGSDPRYLDETHNLAIYDPDTGILLANCTSNDTSYGSWLTFKFVVHANSVTCGYKSKMPTLEWPRKDQLYLRFDTVRPPSLIRNMKFNGYEPLLGCPPVFSSFVKNFTTAGLECEMGSSGGGIPSNTMQPPPQRTIPPTPNVEQLPSQEMLDEKERQEDERFFEKFAPFAGIGSALGQGLALLIH